MIAVRCSAAILLFTCAVLPRAQARAPVTGIVFEDANRNGVRDAGKRELAGRRWR